MLVSTQESWVISVTNQRDEKSGSGIGAAERISAAGRPSGDDEADNGSEGDRLGAV